MDQIETAKALLTSQRRPEAPQWEKGLSTGSTLLNLACSDRLNVGFLQGGQYLLVGDSSSGKSFLSLTCMAEACQNPIFDDFSLVYDNVERGALMDFKRFFGERMASRVIPPAGTKEDPEYSSSIENFHFHAYDIFSKGPAIYVLDSMDALSTDDEAHKFIEEKEAHEKGKEVSGSFGTSKAKANSSRMRILLNKQGENGSILILISQTRSNIGFGSQYNPKTRSGGLALTFYANLEIWSSVKGHIETSYKSKKREQGIICKLHVKKNRLTGRDRKIEVPILHSHGIDDIGSLLDYLIDEGIWAELKGGKIDSGMFVDTAKREDVIEEIQNRGLEKDLKTLVKETWDRIEEAIKVKRHERYH